MNITLADKQYKKLIMLVYMGNWMVNSFRDKEDEIGEFEEMVVIDHGNGWTTQSSHMETITVEKGALVCSGDQIGTMGRTGFVVGRHPEHLDFQIFLNGTPQDPIPLLPPIGTPHQLFPPSILPYRITLSGRVRQQGETIVNIIHQ